MAGRSREVRDDELNVHKKPIGFNYSRAAGQMIGEVQLAASKTLASKACERAVDVLAVRLRWCLLHL